MVSTSRKGALAMGARAMKTRSCPGGISKILRLTASRIILLTRLRTVALPILRLTEKPKRLWDKPLGRRQSTIKGRAQERPSWRTF